MSLLRRLQKKVYRAPGVGYALETLVDLATLPRKQRDLETRFSQFASEDARLQEVIDGAKRAIEERFGNVERTAAEGAAMTVHLPTLLNYITSFAHTSRELTRRDNELKSALEAAQRELATRFSELTERLARAEQRAAEQERINADLVSKLGDTWKRIEFVRSEAMFELRYGGQRTASEREAIAPEVVNKKKLEAMAGDLKVNVGCGHLPDEKYVNVDRRKLPGVDVVADAAGMPFQPESVAELFSSHLIEHFPQEELRRALLPHWYQLVKPGGVVRAILPDWEAMLNDYSKGALPFNDLRDVTFGAQDYDGDFHYNMFTQDSLGKLLEEAGFREPQFPVRGRKNGQCLEMEVVAVK